jgi:hypothetical protein
MTWNGSGAYVLTPTYYPEVNGTVVDADRYNGLMADVELALNNVLAKDGQVSATGNIPLGGNKITGLAAGSVAGDAVRFEQVQRNGVDTIVAAGTTELGSKAAGVITVSGTTTITSFGTTAETGQMKALIFAAATPITYNATSMILPMDASIIAQTGDVAVFAHKGSGNWVCLSWTRNDGSGLAGASLGNLAAATAANTIANADHAQAWQWRLTTAAKQGFSITESAASTGSGSPAARWLSASARTPRSSSSGM